MTAEVWRNAPYCFRDHKSNNNQLRGGSCSKAEWGHFISLHILHILLVAERFCGVQQVEDVRCAFRCLRVAVLEH